MSLLRRCLTGALPVTDNFATISNYFVANSLGGMLGLCFACHLAVTYAHLAAAAMFVVCVGALAWLVIVIFTRSGFHFKLRAF